MKKKETWKFILQTLLSVLSAIATAFGVAELHRLMPMQRYPADACIILTHSRGFMDSYSYFCAANQNRIMQ